jgi:HEAT repeat protein
MSDIQFQQLADALLDESKVFPARYLHRLSDLIPEETHQLEKLWPSVSPRRRTALLEDLEQLGEADDLLSFEEVCRIALKDELPAVRRLAIQILRAYEMPNLIPAFLTMLERDSSPEVRATAAAAMGGFVYMGEIEEIPARILRKIEDCLLRVTTGSDDEHVRRRALEALGFSSRDEVIPLIEKAYTMKDADWQISALYAMGRSADTRWRSQVLARLDDSRPAVRAEAAGAAGELEIKEAVKPLLKLLRDEDDDVRAAAIWSLSQIGGERVAEALEALLEKTEDEDEAELIEDALDNLAFTVDMRNFALLDLPDDEVDLDDNLVEDLDEGVDDDFEAEDEDWEDWEAEQDEDSLA